MLYRFTLSAGLLVCLFSSISAAQADSAWHVYRERFVNAEGRVIDTGNHNISHSEGQGWGMMLAQHYNDQKTFDQIWRWTRRHLNRPDVSLFSWRYDPRDIPAVRDRNNATDGDLFIAWALYLAAERWDNANYASASKSIRSAILENLTYEVAGFQVLLPGIEGFRRNEGADLNLSYWFIPALQDFAEIEPNESWDRLINDGVKLLDQARFGAYLLPTDWVQITQEGELSPATNWAPRFGFDAVRIPLYFVWGGREEASGLGSIKAFWDDPVHQPAPAWVDVVSDERAEYPISRGVDAIRAYVSGETLPSSTPQQQDDYFSATLLMLVHMAEDMH
ncbi:MULTISPECIES: glycosyl hydrolase family 8 [Halomonadaceae]|uniref:cellulase n=1 Tax=Vreelandella sp. SM1641 TaxID=3126101 RepID=A0AAU7XHK4_9GAMM|nr:glycosyl hydrolase family 8 [Halomonas sp. KO116]AJY50165.1 glycoside hydrolase family 8 [Halomonas sp. KO116]